MSILHLSLNAYNNLNPNQDTGRREYEVWNERWMKQSVSSKFALQLTPSLTSTSTSQIVLNWLCRITKLHTLVVSVMKRVYLRIFLNVFVSQVIIDYFFFSYSDYSREYITCLYSLYPSPSSHTFLSRFILSKISNFYCLFQFIPQLYLYLLMYWRFWSDRLHSWISQVWWVSE